MYREQFTSQCIDELEGFLLEANQHGYAGGKEPIKELLRPGFSGYKYERGPWTMVDEYCGHLLAPGQTVIYYNQKPAFIMSYTGGMVHANDPEGVYTRTVYAFLRYALQAMPADHPFRGPLLPVVYTHLDIPNLAYEARFHGSIEHFTINEKILKGSIEPYLPVYSQTIIGGLVVD